MKVIATVFICLAFAAGQQCFGAEEVCNQPMHQISEPIKKEIILEEGNKPF